MRLRSLLLLAVFGMAGNVANAQDTLAVQSTADGWHLRHRVRKSESLFQIARRYKVPPAILADANHLTYNDGLKENSLVTVPLGPYNQQSYLPQKPGTAKALTYVSREADDLYHISRMAAVPQKTLQQWNRLSSDKIGVGRKLFVGWVLVDTLQGAPAPVKAPVAATPAVPAKPVSGTNPVPKPVAGGTISAIKIPVAPATPVVTMDVDSPQMAVDTTDTRSAGELEFDKQTDEGRNVLTEKGTTVFFKSSSMPANGIYNGFHNTAARGAIIRVKNINNGRVVYVKVLGPLPVNKVYYNAGLGMSAAARAALGAREERIFCEYQYAGF